MNLFAFSPNAEKYVPEKLQIRTLFTQWHLLLFEKRLEDNLKSSQITERVIIYATSDSLNHVTTIRAGITCN